MRAHALLPLLALLQGLLGALPAQTAPAGSRPVASSRPTTTSRPATRYSTDPVEDRVAAAFERQRLVGMSIAWIEQGKLAATRSFGFADREKCVLASDTTMYRWASISKPVTAVAAMQLWEQGRLDLDEDVTRLVPEFPAPEFLAQRATITARLLLTHQAGIVHYTNGPVVPRLREHLGEHPFADVVNALDKFADSPLVCEPGTRHWYSTHGYILLGAVVQRAGGEPFWAQVRRRIAVPAGMGSFQPDYPWIEIEGRATGYRKNAAGDVVRSTDNDVSWKLPGGGFISNVSDLARFGAALVRGERVAPATRELMWTRAKTKDGKDTVYGLGFGVRKRQGALEVSHSGGQEKTSTLLVLQPERSRGIALMCNTEGARLAALAEELLALERSR